MSILIEAKSPNPKAAYHLRITKNLDEIKIVHRWTDSVRKEFSLSDQKMIKSLLDKPASFFDSLSKDSVAIIQKQLDSIRTANTLYQSDSTSIYKKSHPAYWKITERVFEMAKENRESQVQVVGNEDITYFFTIANAKDKSYVIMSSLNTTAEPLLTKLVTESLSILSLHRKVMEKRNR